MSRIALTAITPWITAAALAHPHDLAAHLMQRLSVSRRTAGKTIARLVETQWIAQHGMPRRPHHVPGLLRQVVQRHAARQLVCLEFAQGLGRGVDIGVAVAAFDDEFRAADVAQAAIGQPGPGPVPVAVLACHSSSSSSSSAGVYQPRSCAFSSTGVSHESMVSASKSA